MDQRLKARMLTTVVGLNMLWIGLAGGAWLLPCYVVLQSGGNFSISEFRLQAWIFPQYPPDLKAKVGKFLFFLLDGVSPYVALAIAISFVWIGSRFCRFLIVDRLNWLSDKELHDLEKMQWM